MRYKPNSPAEQLHVALSDARHALHKMSVLGVPLKVLEDCDVRLENLTNAAYELPDQIANGEVPPCDSCMHFMETIDLEPYGDRTVKRESHECTVADPLECPVVKACGYDQINILDRIDTIFKREQ